MRSIANSYIRYTICLLICLFSTTTTLLAEDPLNILFIGNSFTLGGPIPDIVRNLAIDAGWAAPNTTNVSVGGQTLSFHSTNANTLAAIDQGGWDFVVLQEYSTKATDNIGDPEEFKSDATFLYDRVKSSSPGAWIILYETWARHEDHSFYPNTFTDRDQMQSQVITHYHDCAENYIPTHATSSVKTDVAIAPAGEAWHVNYHDQNLMLHGSDLYHAGSRGQYLNGLAIYSVIYHRMAAGLNPLLGISSDDAAYLQDICDQVTGETIPQVGHQLNPMIANDIINIDFGRSSIATGNWNIMPSTTGMIDRLITSTGKVTKVEVSIPNRFSGENNNGTTTPDAALNLPSGATSDSYYGNHIAFSGNTEPTAQVMIENLDPTLLYELSFFASRMNVIDNRQTQYALSGSTNQVETLYLDSANNSNRIVTSQPLSPTADGIIQIDIQKGPSNNNYYGFYYLGSVTLKAVNDPYKASNPIPANEAADILPNISLHWTAPDEVQNATYNVYFGENSNFDSILYPGISETAVTPSQLKKGTTYYWRIDVIDSNDGHEFIREGNIWSFSTIPDIPVITVEPESLLVPGGSTATFSLTIDDPVDVTYQWYRNTIVPANLITDDNHISGATTNTLTISDINLTDEQDYICRITNPNGYVDSNSAKLTIKRLLSHWPLDNNLEDIAGGIHGTMTNITPSFATGIVDNALALSGQSNEWVSVGQLGISGDQPRTITGWVNASTQTVPEWTGIFGFSNSTGSQGSYFDIERLGTLGNGYGLHLYNWQSAITTSLPVDEWVFVAASYDGTTVRWYYNGQLIDQENRAINTTDFWTIGKRADNSNVFTGLIDDVRVYNYSLTDKEIAKAWTDLTGGYVCIGNLSMYDFNEDCIVNLNDFLIFASQWLSCNRFPQCYMDNS